MAWMVLLLSATACSPPVSGEQSPEMVAPEAPSHQLAPQPVETETYGLVGALQDLRLPPPPDTAFGRPVVYHVCAGTFSSMAAASAALEGYLAQGWMAQALPPLGVDGPIRLSLGRFHTRAEAELFAAEARRRTGLVLVIEKRNLPG